MSVPDLYLEARKQRALRSGQTPGKDDLISFDTKIKELHERLNVKKCEITIQESERQLLSRGHVEYVISGNDEVDQMNLQSRTTLMVSAFEAVELTMRGNTVTFRKFAIRSEVYQELNDYLKLWADRIRLYPNESHPYMDDFIKMDDYLRQEHKECMLYLANIKLQDERSKKAVKSNNDKWAMSFTDRTPAEVEGSSVTGTNVMPYQSVIDSFPASVWNKT